MRFCLGPIPVSPDFSPENEGWNLLQTSSFLKLQLIATPFIVLSFIVISILVWALLPIHLNQFLLIDFLLTFIVLIPARLVVFSLLHPCQGRSSKSIIGFTLNQLVLLYVYYNDTLSRKRIILILLGPFLFLSIVPLIVAAIFGIGWMWMAYVIVLAGLMGSYDLFMALIILRKIPHRAIVRSRGLETYWKLPSSF